MNILVTNDDGYHSEGIQILASILKTKHNVWLIAPELDRSGVSHGITMKDPLKFVCKGEQAFTCSGLPVDCSLSGGLGLMPLRPDLVVSGINKGANIGTDIMYSGTAAAAREAVFNGIPGIAVSLMPITDITKTNDSVTWYWESMSQFVLQNLTTLKSLCSSDVFVNINALSQEKWKGARLTSISRRTYIDSIKVLECPDGHSYSFFKGGYIDTQGDHTTDWEAVVDGWISVSRVHAQPCIAPLHNEDELNFVVEN